MSNWRLVFFEFENGRSPVREFLDRLPADEAAKVTFDLDLLAEFGVELGMPHVRPIRGKIWELRTTGRSQHRILYVAMTGRQLVLLHAFTKKTPKTPADEIARADRRLHEYLERFGS